MDICSYEWTEIFGAAVIMTTLAKLVPLIRFLRQRMMLESPFKYIHFMDSFE
jgi:hypothetical protein